MVGVPLLWLVGAYACRIAGVPKLSASEWPCMLLNAGTYILL